MAARVIARRGDKTSDDLVDHRLYTVAAAARHLGISATKLRALIQNGALAPTPWGGKETRIAGRTIRRHTNPDDGEVT